MTTFRLLAASLLAFTPLAPSVFGEPTPAPSPASTPRQVAEGVEWEPYVDPEKQIFPSFILANATVVEAENEEAEAAEEPKEEKPDPDEVLFAGDTNGLIGVMLKSKGANTRVKVEILQNAIMDRSVFEGELPLADRDYAVQPKINYNYRALNKERQSMPVNVIFHVWLDGKDLGEKTVTARVRTVNDCLFGYVDPNDPENFQDFSFMFAAYVNEDHPEVRKILKEALEMDIVGSFYAYQSGDSKDVLLQVYSIWSALVARGIKYSDVTTTSSESDSLYSQYVRFFDESLADSQANCVDGSVLLCSILRKAGIKPFLVGVPGHMYMGFYADAAGKEAYCIETTMLGSDLDPAVKKEKHVFDVPDDYKDDEDFLQFTAAVDVGTNAFLGDMKKFEDEKETSYMIIDIEGARKEGIAPVAFIKD